MVQEDEATAREIALEQLILNKRRMVATGEIKEVMMRQVKEKDKGKINTSNVKEAVQVQGNLLLRSIVMEVKRITGCRVRV